MHATDKTTGLTQERLKQLLSYDPRTGVFSWLVCRPNGVKIGDTAGFVAANGYLKIKIDGHSYYASRLAWLYVTGEWPKEMLDHKDRDKLNNRWVNLREATRAQNTANKPGWAKSGFKGVSFDKRPRRKPWAANIRSNGRTRTIGYFSTPEEAHAAYLSAARETFGVFGGA